MLLTFFRTMNATELVKLCTGKLLCKCWLSKEETLVYLLVCLFMSYFFPQQCLLNQDLLLPAK